MVFCYNRKLAAFPLSSPQLFDLDAGLHCPCRPLVGKMCPSLGPTVPSGPHSFQRSGQEEMKFHRWDNNYGPAFCRAHFAYRMWSIDGWGRWIDYNFTRDSKISFIYILWSLAPQEKRQEQQFLSTSNFAEVWFDCYGHQNKLKFRMLYNIISFISDHQLSTMP